jgi:predicted alpha/beta superfamily hydrolase
MEPLEQTPTEEQPSAPPSAPIVWTPGQIHHLGPFEVPGHASRLVRVYLPRAFTPEVPRYALYMFDGQNVFDDEPSFSGGWYAHEAVEKLGQRRLHPIIVGIDHGGEGRIRELSPFPYQDQPGEVDSFLDWIIGTLIPTLAADLPLIPGPVGAVAGGSSMGGLASFYAHFKRPDAFGGALVMSPSFWLGDAEILRWVAEQPLPEVSRVYLDCGGREGKGTLLPLVASMAAHLANRGYDADRLMFRPDTRGTHSERAWRRRLPRALRFFYR